MPHNCVHIVDSDHHRRAAIARQLYNREIHAEIYEDLEELNSRSPTHGAVLINDDTPAAERGMRSDNIASRTGHLPVAFFSASPSPPKIVRAMRAGGSTTCSGPSPSKRSTTTSCGLPSSARRPQGPRSAGPRRTAAPNV